MKVLSLLFFLITLFFGFNASALTMRCYCDYERTCYEDDFVYKGLGEGRTAVYRRQIHQIFKGETEQEIKNRADNLCRDQGMGGDTYWVNCKKVKITEE